MVNAQQLHHVPGRKTDMADCQWLQLLHSCGLLRGSFRPAEAITRLRVLHRQLGYFTRERTPQRLFRPHNRLPAQRCGVADGQPGVSHRLDQGTILRLLRRGPSSARISRTVRGIVGGDSLRGGSSVASVDRAAMGSARHAPR